MKMCLFCGRSSEKGDHAHCRQQLAVMRNDMKRMEAWKVMQLAENGYYGAPPHTADIDPTDWRPRALELREQGLSWRKVCRALNDEGFRSKQGHVLDSVLVLNNLKYKPVGAK